MMSSTQSSGLRENVHDGYVLLITVLIVGSIASAILGSMLMLGTTANRVGIAVQQSGEALAASQACAEYVMRNVRTSLAYTGNETLILERGECEILLIGGTGNNNRLICIEGRSGEVKRRMEIVIAQVLPTTLINSWQEVPAFSLCL